jgi:branched-chain amino acid aminotransferase
MSDAPRKVWLNGELVDGGTARISAFDMAVSHGVGLFETMRAYRGTVFRLDAHIERLRRSAEALKWRAPLDFDALRAAVRQLLAANQLTDARVRLTVTGGTVPPGVEAHPTPTVLATAAPAQAYPGEFYEKGMTVLISKYRQDRDDPLAGHKTICYWPRLIALQEAHEAQCGEALWFTTQNLLAEGCISNVFVVRNGVLKTPPLDTPVLPGIVRAAIQEAATAAGRSVQELPLTINDLLDAEEAFLTNSVMEVMPVCRVERKSIGDGKPGPITKWAAEAYRQLVQREC